MSRLAAVPDLGDSGSLYQYVEIAEPGELGYPTPALPEGDLWAPAVNRVIAEIEAEAVPYTLTPRAEAVLASWDRFRALEHAERVAFGEAEPEPEAEI